MRTLSLPNTQHPRTMHPPPPTNHAPTANQPPTHRPPVQADAVSVMPVTIIFQCVGLKLGGAWIKRFGPRVASLMGCAIVASGILLSSFQVTKQPRFSLGFHSGFTRVSLGVLHARAQFGRHFATSTSH